MIAKTLWACVAIILISYGNAEYDVAKYCELVAPYTKLASLTSCQTYYICQPNGKPIKAKCIGDTEFSKSTQSCVPDTSSSCSFDPANPCKFRNDAFAPSSQGCNMYNWCKNGTIAGFGSCPLGQIFDPIASKCVYGECNNKVNGSSDVGNVCEIMPDNQYFGDFKDCSAWYLCQGFSLSKGNCKNDNVLDVTRGMCLSNNGNMCQRTNNVVNIQPGGPPLEPCTNINQIVADTRVCSVYYVCRPSTSAPAPAFEWVQRSCQSQFFDVMTKKCNGTSQARPYPTCDRCQFTTGYPYWVNAVSLSCSEYHTCNQGRMVGTAPLSCGPERFYNEALQSCIIGETTLEQYEMYHGSCQDYLCNEDRVCAFVDNGGESSNENAVGDQGETNNGGKN